MADDSATSPTAKAIQGTWVTSETDNLDAKWSFKGESVEISVNGQEYTGKFKIDDKVKLPIDPGYRNLRGPRGNGRQDRQGDLQARRREARDHGRLARS